MAIALLLVPPLTGAEPAAPPSPKLGFGSDVASLEALAQAGAPADYGTFWVGTWTLRWGWSGPEADIPRIHAAGATPVIQFYYWGDDISPGCIEDGCESDLHGGTKSMDGWQALAEGLVATLNAKGQGKPVIIVLETEFNKNGVESYEPFDALLAEKATYFRASYPAAKLALGFGNWGHDKWATFDRAVAAVDYVGVQGMRASTRDSVDAYLGLADALLVSAKKVRSTFAKPVLVTDVALSRYPAPEWPQHQEDAMARLAAKRLDLKAAGVVGMVYRSWRDNPTFDTANYFGVAERHWGLANSEGTAKPAAQAWLDMVAAERIVPKVTFSVSPSVNEWWVEVDADGNVPLARVDAVVNGKTVPLKLHSWGNWAAKTYVPRGTAVSFRADVGDPSITYSWLTVPATFSLSPNVNRWWVEVHVKSPETVTKVDVLVNGKATALVHEEWGAWAKSMNVPGGSKVQFRASNEVGWTTLSPTYAWK